MNERVFVCVGPNKGDMSMLQIMQGHDRFYMFEPLPEAADYLRRKNAHMTDIFHVVQAACGEADGMRTLTVYNHDGVSSSLGVCTEQARQMYPQADLCQKEQLEVHVVNLCSFLEWAGVKQIETLMIDAQGMDLAILKTMRPFFERRAVRRVIHEIDVDGFRHYDGLPDNSLSGAVQYMEQFGSYQPYRLPDRNDFNFDLEWRLTEC